jgi:O-antigen ligase
MFRFHRVLIGYAIAIPLAVVLGYVLATPDLTTFAVVGMVLFVLILPLLIQWHHWLLIITWNAVFIANFLPGQLQLWVIFAAITFGMAVVHRFMGHRNFLRAPELTKPILFLVAVVVLTGRVRGGLGMRILGSGSYGGKNYFYVLVAVIGYFALISQPISILKGARAAKWFFLAGTTNVISNLLYALGPFSWFLFWFLPTGGLTGQISYTWSETPVQRFTGFGPAGPFVLCFALARWGTRGLFEWDKPWRLLLVGLALVASMYSGFRSQVAFLLVLLAIQFMVEGLWKTPLLPALVLLGMIGLVPVLVFANKMPDAMQRSLAFLPVDINPDIRADAEGSTEWRLGMWKEVWPEIPKYLFLGKGYSLDPDELYLTMVGTQSGVLSGYEGSLLAGDYHNGPLSILIPFGLFGTLAFVWLLVAGIKVLWRNYRYGDARLRRVNVTLLAYFVTQCLFFILIFGAFNSQLAVFLGILGFSVSLNGGVCRRPALPRQTVFPPALAPSVAIA